jgi:glycosyltransferase involved in cell wall biosynthesis
MSAVRPGPAGVLYVANAARIGGGNRVLMDLMRNLDPARFDPVLVSPDEGELPAWARTTGIPVHVVPDGDWHGALPLARRTAALVRLILRERAAIVHASAPTCYRAAGLAGLLTGRARVCHLGFPPEDGELERSFVSGPDVVIGCYEGQATAHAGEIGRLKPRCRVIGIPNGVDTARFRPQAPDAEIAALRAGARQVVAILGHISDVKGHPTFVEAAAQVAAAFPDTRFLAIGGENLQPGLRTALERRAASLGLGARLQFLGFRSDVERVLRAVDVVALPSRAEGFPLAVLEAMACGKPVVATPVGGVGEAVVDGVRGGGAARRPAPVLRPPLRGDGAGRLYRAADPAPRRRRRAALHRRQRLDPPVTPP